MAQQSTTLAALPEETKFDSQNPLDGSQPTGTADPGHRTPLLASKSTAYMCGIADM